MAAPLAITLADPGALLRRREDALLVLLAAAHGLLGVAVLASGAPLLAAAFVALGTWWGSNTVSHNHLHHPLFRSRALNGLFSGYLTLLLLIPQRRWALRHLWHHAGEPAGFDRKLGVDGHLEQSLLGGLFLVLGATQPRLFFLGVLPGYLVALSLCWLQGRLEHLGTGVSNGAAVSHYGALYNLLWLNDGFHAEHHRRPGTHWSELPALRHEASPARISPFAPLLRWAELPGPLANRFQAHALVVLELASMRVPSFLDYMVRRHEAAFREVLSGRPAPRRVAIVGGGLFPRSLLVLRRIFPDAALTVFDDREESIATAREYLARRGLAAPDFAARRFTPEQAKGFDLCVIPLGFRGDREALYASPAAPTLIHDWAWRRGGRGAWVSRPLLKRVNLVA